MKRIYYLMFFLCCTAVGAANAQYKDLLNFNAQNYPLGATPKGSLILSGSRLFGMTQLNIFSIDTNGSGYKDIHDFYDTGFQSYNGYSPWGSLIMSGNTFYAMTLAGGIYNDGVIFKIDTDGTGYKKLLDFNGSNGKNPIGDLKLSGGILYGMTQVGGAYTNYGNIFSIDTDGTGFKDLFDFNGVTGSQPWGDVIICGNKLYGMTQYGGVNDSGCIFSISTNGSGYKDLFDFDGPNGTNPLGSLLLSGNLLFGETSGGGKYEGGNIFSIDTNGLVFTDLYDFNDSSGAYPQNSLILSGGFLYGITGAGGKYLYGNIFSISKSGTGYTDLYQFRKPGGTWSSSNLTPLGSILYGMSWDGGTYGEGSVFSYNYSNPQGIEELTTDNGAKVLLYPNPSNGVFTVESSVVSHQLSVEVYNELGQKVYSEPPRQAQGDNQIDISNLPSGIYFYRVTTEQGEFIGSGKLVIQ